ncbi:MAG: trigger factor [Propionibacteriaceae bacterium]|nr:trigger factor [Propionibacteriaceae bacterium]
MPSTVEKLSATRAKLTIEIPFTDLKAPIGKAYRDLASQVSIPGFRKGHVPAAMIDARVGREVVLNEAVNAVLPKVYAEAVEEHKLTPLTRPEIEMTKLVDGEVAEFVAEVDIVPEFDLPDFSAIEVTVDPVAPTEAQVDERVELLRERFAEVEDVDRPAEEGDQVQIDLSGAQNGEVLSDATAEGLTYVVGAKNMLDGLDEAVTGARAGDTRTFSSTLLGGGHEGEEADITVTVTKVQRRTLPEVDDEFAQLVSQFDTVDQMRADLAKSVERMGRVNQLSAARDRVLDQALAMIDVELPERLVDEEAASRVAQVTEQLQGAGMSLEDYLARMGDEKITTADQFAASTRDSIERGIRAEILLSRVADESKVAVDQDDLTNFIFQKAQENGTTAEQEIQHMQSHDHLAEWMGQIRQSKALDSIVAKAKIADTDGGVVDVASVMPKPAAPASEVVEEIVVDQS